MAGYACWGAHSRLGHQYSLESTPPGAHIEVKWGSNSDWWIIETMESFNGMPYKGHGDYFMWFSKHAFGGTDAEPYSRTPVGAVTHSDEPGRPNWNIPEVYLPLWAQGATFSYSAWASPGDAVFTGVGDPFVRR